jgi:hypothetical protein
VKVRLQCNFVVAKRLYAAGSIVELDDPKFEFIRELEDMMTLIEEAEPPPPEPPPVAVVATRKGIRKH